MAKFVIVCEDSDDPANLSTYNPIDGTTGGGVGVPLCLGPVSYLPASTQAPFDASMVDPAIATQMFAGGFFFMVPVWAACIGVRYLIGMLR